MYRIPGRILKIVNTNYFGKERKRMREQESKNLFTVRSFYLLILLSCTSIAYSKPHSNIKVYFKVF